MGKRRRLKTAEDVRRLLASIINKLEVDEIDESKAGKLGYLAGILMKAIQGDEFEKRLERLENKIKG